VPPGGPLPDALRELVRPGQTLVLLGGPRQVRSMLVDALAGVTTLPVRPADPGLVGHAPDRQTSRATVVPVPGGGAVLDVADDPPGEGSSRPPLRLAAVAGTAPGTRRPRH
jgi:hypothetical protein